jgi:hypothetical protein
LRDFGAGVPWCVAMARKCFEPLCGVLGVVLVLGAHVDAVAAHRARKGNALDRPAAPAEVPLPDRVSFHLEDGRHRSPGLSLSFALPRSSDYQCRRLAFRQERRGSDVEAVFDGVLVPAAVEEFICRGAKQPLPIRERILLPSEPGSYRLTFVKGEKRDVYALTIAANAVTLEPLGAVSFTECEETGKLARMDPRWLRIRLAFITEESRTKLRDQRDELLQELAAMGAKPLSIPGGRYLMDGFVEQLPGEPGARGAAAEAHYFVWDGDWAKLRTLAARYAKYARISPGRPAMQLWLSSRDHVVSTVGGSVSGDEAGEL